MVGSLLHLGKAHTTEILLTEILYLARKVIEEKLRFKTLCGPKDWGKLEQNKVKSNCILTVIQFKEQYLFRQTCLPNFSLKQTWGWFECDG